MSQWAPRRFWRDASVSPGSDGFAVLLDGRPLRTPAKAPFLVPSRALAEAVAEEWRQVGEAVDPRLMPATRLVNVALDRLPAARDAVVAEVAGFGASDLLCYRAASQPELALRQEAEWGPWLAWAASLGAPLLVAEGLMPVDQPPASLRALAARVAARDDLALALLHELVALSGSLVLGLAVAEGRLGAPEAWRVSRLDEDFQAEEWGRDEEAEAAAEGRRRAFLGAARLLGMLG